MADTGSYPEMVGTEKGQSNEALTLDRLSGGSPMRESVSESLAEAVKPVGLLMTPNHDYYWNGRGPMPGPSNVLKVLQKWELARYRENQIEDYAIRFGPWLEKGDAPAIVDAIRDQAASLGITVHHWAHLIGADEKAAEGVEISEWVIPYLVGYRGFLGHLRASGGEILSAEHAVINLTEGYGGTYDLIVRYQGQVWLLDLKTSAGYYPEFALQIAAYGHGEFVALPNDPTQYPMPQIERYGVVHLRPDQYPDTGWRLVEYPITGKDYVAFLAALELYRWKGEGRFTRSILRKAIVQGAIETEIRSDPLTTEDRV